MSEGVPLKNLSSKERDVIIAALRIAAEAYDNDEKTFRQAEIDIGNGRSVPMFVAGVEGCRAAKRLADQFYRQAEDVREVLKKLEGDDE